MGTRRRSSALRERDGPAYGLAMDRARGRRVKCALVVGLVGLAGVAGCKKPSTDAAPPAAAGTTTPEAFCRGIFGASLFTPDPKCSEAENAVEEGTYGKLLRMQITNCKTELEASVARSRVKLDSAAGATCISAIRDGEHRHDRVDHWKTKACDGYINGAQASGAACRQTWECAAPLACSGFTREKDGVCKEPPTAKNAPCGAVVSQGEARYDLVIGTRKECGAGSYCFVGECTLQAAAGGACTADKQCLDGLACRAGLCAKPDRLAAGASCKTVEDCAPGLTCLHDRAAKTAACGPQKAAGTPCEDDDDCKGRCKNNACVSWCKSG